MYHSNIVPHLVRSTTAGRLSKESPHSSRSAQMTYKYSVIFVRLLFPTTLLVRNAFACVDASVCVWVTSPESSYLGKTVTRGPPVLLGAAS